MVCQLEDMKRTRMIKEEGRGSPSPTASPSHLQQHVTASNNSRHLNNNNSIKRSLHNQTIPPTSSNIEVYELFSKIYHSLTQPNE